MSDDFIPLSEPNISGVEWEYVKDCLDTGWVSSAGPWVSRFEERFAMAVEAEHAVAMASGTAALHIGLILAGVAPGDEVLVPSLTFIASANAIRYVGAWPVFMDCDPHTLQVTPETYRRFLDEECDAGRVNRRTGRRVQALVPVHVLGHPCDIDGIRAVADEVGISIVEDAAEALGSRVRGRTVGSGSRIACFSFNGNKIMTTGGGGILTTDDDELAAQARYLSTQAKDDPVRYVHGETGYNYRLTNVQAAIGCAQLEQLDSFLQRKRGIAARYSAAFGDLEALRVPSEAEWASSNWWLYTVFLADARTDWTTDRLMAALHARGIQTRPLWQPLHRSPAFAAIEARECPTADAVHRTGLSLPCSTGLPPWKQERVIDSIRELLAS